MKPFIDYYSQNNISPVAQDVSDLSRHFDRRAALYRALGIAPSFISGRSIIEFGPGSGYNSVYTASLQPSSYLLVEGNPVGVLETAKRFKEFAVPPGAFRIVEALIEEFETDERFDLALCEGTIPFQFEPEKFARKVGSFCKPAGVLVITCVASATFMGEITRRLIASRHVREGMTIGEKVAALRPVFSSHLATLTDMSRPVDDWILDNIVHPLTGRTFAIDEAIDAVGVEFEVFGQSPHFVQDWRWYKAIWGDRQHYNERAKAAYLSNMANFLDYRIEVPPHEPSVGAEISRISNAIYTDMQAHERGVAGSLEAACAGLDRLIETIVKISPQTAASLRACLAYLRGESRNLDDFASYFARGQQYLSFIKRGHPGAGV